MSVSKDDLPGRTTPVLSGKERGDMIEGCMVCSVASCFFVQYQVCFYFKQRAKYVEKRSFKVKSTQPKLEEKPFSYKRKCGPSSLIGFHDS